MTDFFGRGTFRFLRDLAENNDREWFTANRDRYEAELRDPALRLILAVGERLDRVSPHLRADPRGNGGSLFRIFRDVRFSRDKRPYKTHVGVQFRHAAGKDAHAPGLYLHVEPKASFFGFGMWRPPAPALKAIRTRIVEDSDGWRAAIGGRRFVETFDLDGDTLTRAPRGFDPEHPLVDDLRRKDFVGRCSLTEKEVLAPGLDRRIVELGELARPMMAFLCDATGVPF